MLWLIAVVLLLVIAVPVGLWLGLRSEAGSSWLLGQVPGLTLKGVKGSLLGDFSADRLELKIGANGRLILIEPAWQDLRIRRSPLDGHWVAVDIEKLSARAAELIPDDTPKKDEPLTAPEHLKLPLTVKIDALDIGEFRTAALGDKPVRDLRGSIDLAADSGRQHQVQIDNVEWDQFRVKGSLKVGSDGEMVLDSQLQLGPSGAATAATESAIPFDDWVARLALNGPLRKPTLDASASGDGRELLQAQAVLQPFEPWPLADLEARTKDLDLAMFSSELPKTALTGSAKVETAGLDKPAKADIRLANREAGMWNAKRLPLRELQLDLQARPDAPQVASIRRFVAELGSASLPAGRISGKGEFDQGKFSVEAVLDKLLPARLDARAPVMSLSGPINVDGRLPAAAAAGGPAPTGDDAMLHVDTRAKLRGSIDIAAEAEAFGKPAQKTGTAAGSTSRSLAVDLDAAMRSGPAGQLQLDIKQAQIDAAGADVRIDGKLRRDEADAPLRVDAELRMKEFDPRPWLPSADAAGWRRGRSRINATADVDLQLLPQPAAASEKKPSAAGSADPVRQGLAALDAVLATLRGKAALTLQPSQFAGIAIEGQAGLNVDGAIPGPGIAAADVALRSGSNRVKAALRTRADRPAADRLELDIDAPALGELADAARLLGLPAGGVAKGGAKPAAPALAGSVTAKAEVNGRWPSLRTDGRLAARGLKIPDLSVTRADVDWKLGTSPDSPVDLKADIAGLVTAAAAVERADLKLSGTAREHRIELSADSSMLPPAWTDALTGATTAVAKAGKPAAIPTGGPAPTSARLRASGGLLDVTGITARNAVPSANGWRGRIDELRLRSGANPDAALAVRGDDLGLTTRWSGAAPTLSLQPGRLEMQAGPTVATLRWSRVEVQAGAPAAKGRAAVPPRIDVEATLDPIAVAPLLARFQPDFGWGGDLRVGGAFSVRSNPALRADIVIDRKSGDLSVTEGTNVQQLGLSDLRVALDARDGVWNTTLALAGSTLGVASGALVARTGSPTAWPDAGTPLEGVVELRVEKLSTWGPWVPTGWRLDGSLHTSASFGGRIGAPEITGQLRGSNITARNFVEGVNVTDGQIAVTLKGETARIETFTARAGDGTVSLTGNAQLGATPKANLRLKADRFQLLGRVDRRIVASGQGELNLGEKKIALDGKFKVDEGLIDFTRGGAPSLSDDVTVIRAERGPDGKIIEVKSRSGDEKPPPKEPKKQSAAARALALDLRVDLGSNLRLKGRGLNTGLKGELHVTSPGGNLAVNGTVSTVDGVFKAYGQNLKIDRGSVIFIGPVDNPRLDIQAVRGDTNTDVTVGVRVTGNVANLRIKLFSEPEMSEIDKLSMLVLGRATEGTGRAETALLQRAAFALLAGDGESTTDKVSRALGLDELSLRQTDGEVKETVVSLGKQISDKVYVGYERGLNATAGSWQLIYRLAQRFTLRAQAGYENSVDLIWTWRWR
ncbi:translocation/assembly module TamB domain-containing protein [Piscinibacter sakaiensis]|uniref:translocation/assembly module TamB domain-containing protein n=1 Tax=Piscinibacter sakaiensis TaxID=1547922 RepID=UPI003AAD985B